MLILSTTANCKGEILPYIATLTYIEALTQHVQRFWNDETDLPPEIGSDQRAILTFYVKRSGEIDKLRVTCPSGNCAYDQVAIHAIERSTPFDPLPNTYKGNDIEINFTFGMHFFGEKPLPIH